MFYLIPPAGTPISLNDLYKILSFRIRKRDVSDLLKDRFRDSFAASHCFTYDSGRTSLYYLLNALFALKGKKRNEVVIPAYTCFSVPASIAKAGLKIRLADIDPLTMDYKYDNLGSIDPGNILAIVACNMFGIASNWKLLNDISSRMGTYLIDDAAQSMGVECEGNLCGTHGDAGFFSLGRGKNISAYSGGVLITNNTEIANELEKNARTIEESNLVDELAVFIKMGLYGVFLRPWLYWLPEIIPFLGIGETIFDEKFGTRDLTKIQSSAAIIQFERLEKLNAERIKNSQMLAQALNKSACFQIPGYKSTACPAYLRFPLLVKEQSRRNDLIKALRRSGIAATTMYPSTISNIRHIDKYLANVQREFPGAQYVVDRLITLPTHSFVSERDIQKIIACLLKEE